MLQNLHPAKQYQYTMPSWKKGGEKKVNTRTICPSIIMSIGEAELSFNMLVQYTVLYTTTLYVYVQMNCKFLYCPVLSSNKPSF